MLPLGIKNKPITKPANFAQLQIDNRAVLAKAIALV